MILSGPWYNFVVLQSRGKKRRDKKSKLEKGKQFKFLSPPASDCTVLLLLMRFGSLEEGEEVARVFAARIEIH